MTAKPRPPPRKSLKQSLKDVFLRRRRQASNPSLATVGSGILRKAELSDFYLSSITTFSSFPDLTDSQFCLDEHTISPAIPNRFQAPTRQGTIRSKVPHTLLPATSLSQFNLHQAYLQKSSVPYQPGYQVVSPTYTPIVSREASFASLSTFSSASTLRLQDSRRQLVDRDLPRPPTIASVDRPVLERHGQTKHVSWLQSPTASSLSVSQVSSAKPSRADIPDSTGIRQVEHFKSFCILDTTLRGYPIVATSQENRYIFEIGEQFFLNSCECEGTSMDIVTGQDAAGDPVTHLVLFTPLVIPSSGRSRFMLASLIDVTRFIHDAASLPELEKASDSSTIESDVHTPLHDRLPSSWNPAQYKLSAEDLLGGCVLADDRELCKKPAKESPDDIWLNLALEEKRSSGARDTYLSTPRSKRTPRSSNTSHASTISSTVDEVLDDFMSDLQELYSEFFLLGKSPLDDTYFEICKVSPMLYATKDYINGHLSHTRQQAIIELSTRLAQDSPFDVEVKWGSQGLDKCLYCSPLYGQNSITWICFLVDRQMPTLW